MAGYRGYSMSNNAYEQYESGEKPKSKWTKYDILEECRYAGVPEEQLRVLAKIPVQDLRFYGLRYSSWHHTSSHYNRTEFYTVDVDYLATMQPIERPREKKAEPTYEIWYADYLIWSGTRNHPKQTEYSELGVKKGNWFYSATGDKKSVDSRGFRLVEEVKRPSKEQIQSLSYAFRRAGIKK